MDAIILDGNRIYLYSHPTKISEFNSSGLSKSHGTSLLQKSLLKKKSVCSFE